MQDERLAGLQPPFHLGVGRVALPQFHNLSPGAALCHREHRPVVAAPKQDSCRHREDVGGLPDHDPDFHTIAVAQSFGGGRGKPTTTGQQGKDGQRRPMFRRRKVCKFCADKIDDINYKDVKLLASFVPERAKVLPRRISGTCALHQRKLRLAITRARVLALLPFLAD